MSGIMTYLATRSLREPLASSGEGIAPSVRPRPRTIYEAEPTPPIGAPAPLEQAPPSAEQSETQIEPAPQPPASPPAASAAAPLPRAFDSPRPDAPQRVNPPLPPRAVANGHSDPSAPETLLRPAERLQPRPAEGDDAPTRRLRRDDAEAPAARDAVSPARSIAAPARFAPPSAKTSEPPAPSPETPASRPSAPPAPRALSPEQAGVHSRAATPDQAEPVLRPRPVSPRGEAPLAVAARARHAAPAPAPAPPRVTVTIGRIEIRTAAAEPARPSAPAPRPAPAMSLDDYLARRERG